MTSMKSRRNNFLQPFSTEWRTAMPSQFFWHELMTTDTKAAQKFYGDVVGWTARIPACRAAIHAVQCRRSGRRRHADDHPGHGQAWRASRLAGLYLGGRCGSGRWRASSRKAARSMSSRRTFRASSASPWSPIRKARPFMIAKGLLRQSAAALAHGHARHRRLARVDGATGRPPSPSMRRCSAGPRPRRMTWARWASISSSPPAARPSAA